MHRKWSTNRMVMYIITVMDVEKHLLKVKSYKGGGPNGLSV